MSSKQSDERKEPFDHKQPNPWRERIRDLRSHPDPYVTVGELADYWLVSRKQIYKQIDAGTLRAIKLGPRLLRISTAEAIEFERRANLHPPTLEQINSAAANDDSDDPELRVRRR